MSSIMLLHHGSIIDYADDLVMENIIESDTDAEHSSALVYWYIIWCNRLKNAKYCFDNGSSQPRMVSSHKKI